MHVRKKCCNIYVITYVPSVAVPCGFIIRKHNNTHKSPLHDKSFSVLESTCVCVRVCVCVIINMIILKGGAALPIYSARSSTVSRSQIDRSTLRSRLGQAPRD